MAGWSASFEKDYLLAGSSTPQVEKGRRANVKRKKAMDNTLELFHDVMKAGSSRQP
jgi:hypothetical protein